MQQAFLNLIKNAIDAMGDTGDIHIKASRHSAIDKAGEEAEIYNYLKYHGKCTLEEDTVDIMIKDNGPGHTAGNTFEDIRSLFYHKRCRQRIRSRLVHCS